MNKKNSVGTNISKELLTKLVDKKHHLPKVMKGLF